MEKLLTKQEGNKIAELEEEAEHARKEGKKQELRAKAAAQARIKDLETKLLASKVDSSKEIENLKAENEVLKSSREWTLFENMKLTEQINVGKSKLEDLRGELDASLNATIFYREKLEAEESRTESLNSELKAARLTLHQLTDEREFYQKEITRLKDAITAQDELVSLLEGDVIVYEAHVGILRESLGASKEKDRQFIKSKAFNAKLNALELEKKEISKRSNDERIRTKALNLKIRMLEEERDQLILRLQQYEGESSHHVGDSLASTDDELQDSRPTFDEQSALNVGLEQSTISEPAYASGTSFEAHVEIPPADTLVQPSDIQSPTSTVQTVNYIPDVESGSQTLIENEQSVQNVEEDSQLLAELEQMKDQRTESIAILNHFMQEICEHLRRHFQKPLADQLEQELRTYLISPDLDLVIVTNQVRRFIDEVINSLVCDVSTLRIEKDALHEQYELTRFALHEAEHVKREVADARHQLEANKKRFDSSWQLVKNTLLKNNADDVPDEGQPQESEQPHQELTEQLRFDLEQKIAHLQADNNMVSDEYSYTLTQLNAAREQNNQLDQQVEGLRSELDHLRVETELSRNCIDDLRNNSTLLMEERDEMERKIALLQTENVQSTNEHARVMASLNDSQQQNGQLEQIADALRSELDRMRIEVELSRSCLDDLRNNSNWQRQNANLVRPQAQQPAQSIQQHVPLQQTPASAFMPVERAVENTAREALQVGGMQQRGNEHIQLEQQPGPSHYHSSNQIHMPADSNEAAILGEITQASQRVAHYLQSQSERASSAPFLSRQQVNVLSADSQTEHASLQHSLTQTDHLDESRQQIQRLEEALSQKESAIETLTSERDHLNQLYFGLNNAYQTLQAELEEVKQTLAGKEQETVQAVKQHSNESEHFHASIAELQQNINQLAAERDSLQQALNVQKQRFDEEISRRDLIQQQQFVQESSNAQAQNSHLNEEIANLRHQIVQLSAESMYNAQLNNERNYLHQQLNELKAQHEHEIEVLKRDLHREHEINVQRESPFPVLSVDFCLKVMCAQQFNNTSATNDEFVQTDTQIVHIPEQQIAIEQPTVNVEVALKQSAFESVPQFSANAMTRVVQEQREILQACIEENVQMENYMSHGVEHLMALNNELEQCAESIKAQVHALNQQIASELSDQTQQLTQNLERSQLVSSGQLGQLRSELASTRSENELNLQRIDEFQTTHRELQRTYDELIERYAELQQSFEQLQNAHAVRAKTEEKSTDSLLDGSTIDQMYALNSTIEEMSVASTEARNQLNEYQQRLQSLQLLMSTQLNSTQDKMRELRSDEFVALKSSVVASISEFKMYLLQSFGQLQQALETTRSGETSRLAPPDEASVRRELENTERVSRALVLCEKICRDIEEDSHQINEHATSSACLETMLKKIYSHWRAKQDELAEKAKALTEQRNLSKALEGRLNEAELQLNLLEGRRADSSGAAQHPMSPLSANNQSESNLHLAIMAARLTTKEADNQALFRCNAELAKTNVDLYTRVEHLQDCVQRVSDELDAVTNSISSNSRQSSLTSLNVKQPEDQERQTPPSNRRRNESDEFSREHLPAVNEDLNEPVETTLNTSLNRHQTVEHLAQVSVATKSQESSSSTVTLVTKKKKKAKKIEKPLEKIQEPIQPAIEQNVQEDWGWNEDQVEDQVEEQQTSRQASPSKSKTKSPSPVQDEWGWNEDQVEEPTKSNAAQKVRTPSPVQEEWGWNEDQVEEQTSRQASPSKSKAKSPSPVQDEWGWNEDSADVDQQAEDAWNESNDAEENKDDENWDW
ncbi:hypothetical protein M3Y97_00619600 [Aphelenchoides bicaudatus]|nr:hypothetical protein M3Y97_00619600 [Aphelenchoides bicaudatus]